MIYKLIGWFLKRQRIKKNLTLREFCQIYHHDSHTISKIERGYYFKEAPEENREWVIEQLRQDIGHRQNF